MSESQKIISGKPTEAYSSMDKHDLNFCEVLQNISNIEPITTKLLKIKNNNVQKISKALWF
jgi:hypothetical protein